MKYCENCGTQLDDNARFCKKCGVFFDVAGNGADGAEVPQGAKETAQPISADESQEQQNSAAASAPEQTNEPGDVDKTSADKKSGYIGCIVLIFLVVVLFKGCGMLFGSDDEEQIKKIGIEHMQTTATIMKRSNKNFFAKNYKVKNIKISGDRATAILYCEIGSTGEKYEQIYHFKKIGDNWSISVP